MKEDLQQELLEVKATKLLSLKTTEEEFSVPKDYFSKKKKSLHKIADIEAIEEDYFEQKKTSLKQIANQTKVVQLQQKETIQKSKIKHQNWMMIAASLFILVMAIPVVKNLSTNSNNIQFSEMVENGTLTITELALLNGDMETFLYDNFYNEESEVLEETTDYTELDDLFSIEQL